MRIVPMLVLLGLSASSTATEFTLDAIEARAEREVMTPDERADARLQGECLVGIKQLNFTGGEYDPIEEWLRARTTQLLQRHDPCTTLAMLEVTKRHLEAERAALQRGATDG
ncbi:MAG: hypothetical protein AAGE01_11090 [Pseudomonadota bacterium]